MLLELKVGLEALNKDMVDLLHRKGMKIQLWPVNGPEEMKEATDLGVYFIQTDTF